MKKILFFVFLLFMFCGVVKANDTILVKDRIDNTFTYFYDNSQSRFRYLLTSKYIFGDDIAYCIELGKPIDSFNYTYSNSFDGANLSKEDINYIKLAAYYGYNYPGHNTNGYYLAAQDIIWKRLSNISVRYIWDMDVTNCIDISKEKEEIYLLMSKHAIKPSFYNDTVDVIHGKEYTLVDTNEILSNYVSTNNNVYIDGNKLIIKSGFNDDVINLVRKHYTDKQFFLYSSGNNQKMMSSGNLNDDGINIKINLTDGSIKLKKLDKETGNVSLGEATLNGAIYDLYDSEMNYIDSFVTGKKDKISGLPIGHYYIKEKTASEGYMLDLNTYDVTIDENDLNKEIIVYEDIIKRKVDVFKVFDNGGTGILTTEEGVIFDIYDSTNNKLDSITTDSDGYASIVLPYGVYTFKQVTSTKDYYKVDDFKVIIDKYDTRPIYKLLSDSEITARVKIIKKDFDTSDNIVNSDIKFKIYDVREKKYVSFNVTYPEVSTIDTFSLSSSGEFITSDVLHSGEYILYEVDQNMNGYLYNKDGVHFYIGEESNFINDEDYGTILEIPFYNKIVKGKIIINKYGEETNYIDNSYYYKNIMLSNVYFELYAKDDIYENNKLIYKKDTLVDTIITDSKGKGVRDNLPLGKYYLKEIKSNNDNVFDDTVYDIELEYKDQYTEKINYEIDINNYLNKGKIIIHKLDANTNEVIANTLIEIRNKDNVIVYKGYTDNNGMIVIDDLPYGEYYIAEIEASTGYRILEDNIYFTLDSETYETTIYNERMEVPNTGINVGLKNILVIAMIILFGFVMILFFDNKKIVGVSTLFIIIGIGYFGIYFYNYFTDGRKNILAIEKILNNDNKDVSLEDRYGYNSFIEIPSIELKRGLVNINNSYNNVNDNIETIEKTDNRIILASHNGNNYNSYFGNLYKMDLGDKIYLYDNGNRYEYIFSDNYEIKKNGYADIYTDNTRKSIVLVTCKEDSSDAQVVYIGYLTNTSSYLKEQ